MYRNCQNMSYVLLFSCSIYTSFTVKFDLVLKPIILTKNNNWQSLEIYAKYHLWII